MIISTKPSYRNAILLVAIYHISQSLSPIYIKIIASHRRFPLLGLPLARRSAVTYCLKHYDFRHIHAAYRQVKIIAFSTCIYTYRAGAYRPSNARHATRRAAARTGDARRENVTCRC